MGIETQEQFRAWLEEQPREVCVAIAYRAAMRVLPIGAFTEKDDGSMDGFLLQSLRALLTTAVLLKSDNLELRRRAYRLSFSRIGDAFEAAMQACQAAATPDRAAFIRGAYRSFDAAGHAFAMAAAETAIEGNKQEERVRASMMADSLVFSDTQAEVGDLISKSVLPLQERLESVLRKWTQSRFDILRSGGPWAFWAEWYRRAMAGDPMPWDLQEAVALIPNDIWETGPEAVAEEIEKLRLRHRTDVLPRLERSAERDLFEVEQGPVAPDEVAEFVRNRVRIAFRVALDGAGPNGFDENSPEALEISLTLNAESNSVSVLATGFWAACLSLNERIGDIYPDDTSLKNLKNTLYGAVEELCELDAKAKERCGRIAELVIARRVDDEDRAMVANAPSVVAEEVSEEARAIIESDVERILNDPQPPKTVRARFTNWMTTISIWMDRGMKTDKRAAWLADLVERLRGWWGPGE